MELPAEFKETVINVNGDAGKKWLLNFDNLVTYCEDKWRFKLMPHYKLSFNFVAPVELEDGSKAVLKLCVPSAGMNNEMATLKAYNGNGFCKLHDADTGRGILLLEHLYEPLTAVTDNVKATKIAAKLIREIKSEAIGIFHSFPVIADHAKSILFLKEKFNDDTSLIPKEFLKQAEVFYKYLSNTMNDAYLLHGDLHHENILSACGNSWKAIDPKGIIGETGYELIPFLMNNLNGRDISAIIEERINIFSEELLLEKDRIIKWAVFRSVLSLCWKIEDKMTITANDLEIAGVFYEMSIGL
jgi:streptomycin 6-kinase